MSITRYFIPLTMGESPNTETLEAGKAAAEAVIMADNGMCVVLYTKVQIFTCSSSNYRGQSCHK